jgi:uncharacterized membrane protein
MAETPKPDLLMDAILLPHRSLTSHGFLLLMALLSVISFAAGVAFMLVGAWPVFFFLGLDVALIYVAFRASYRSALLHEKVRLSRESLEIERVLPSGAVRKWTFQPYWLRVTVEKRDGAASRLVVGLHGKTVEIGAFLPTGERESFAEALRAALARVREPA